MELLDFGVLQGHGLKEQIFVVNIVDLKNRVHVTAIEQAGGVGLELNLDYQV